MINKFFNWVFGSFFRTAGRFLFYFLLFLLLSFLIQSCEVKAAVEGIGWYEKNVKSTITSSRILNWTSASNFTPITTTMTPILTTETTKYASIPSSSNNLNVHGAGVSYQIYVEQQMKPGYLYSIELYTCNFTESAKFHNLLFELGSGLNPNASPTNVPTYSYATASDISTTYAVPIDASIQPFESCYVFTSLISPSTEGAWFDIKFRNNTNISFYPFLMGYTMQELGIYDKALESTINNIVQNSGLATASSVSEVQSSVNQVKQEMVEVNSSIDEQTQQQQQNHEETMNTITSDEGADLGALENSAGWLPAGPVDSILNLPLSLMNNLTTNLNKSCSPLVVPLPFIDKDLRIPCLNTIYESIDGLNVWITTISIIASGFILYSYFLKLYKWVEDTLMFNDSSGLSSWGGV